MQVTMGGGGLLEVSVILPKDSGNLLLEASKLIPKVFQLGLYDSLSGVLLPKSFFKIVGLEIFFQDILQTKISRKKHLCLFLLKHPPEMVNHVQIRPSLKRSFVSRMLPQSCFTLQGNGVEEVFHGMGQTDFL